MERKKRRKIKIIPFIVCFSFLVLALGVGYVLADQFIFNDKLPSLSLTDDDKEKEEVIDLEGRTNFLLMGIDAREGETKTRTDSLILVSVDKEKNRVAMISMPRDTRVKIPGHGYDKINAANVYGGPELVMEVVSDLMGVKIDNYLMTNVRGFRDIVDTMGGVTIDVEKRMYHYDPYDEPDLRKIDLKPGVQKLDGNKALQYVRFRSDALGDVSRTERQQKFLKVLAQEMMQPSTITKLPKLVPTINKYLDTNLSLSQMVTLAMAGKNLGNVEILTQTLPGKFLDMNGISYWSVDPQQAKMVAKSIIQEGKVYDVVLGQETVNTKNVASESNTKPKDKDYLPVDSNTKKTSDTTSKSKTSQDTKEKTESKTDQTKPDSNAPKGTDVKITVNPPGNSGTEQPATGNGTTESQKKPINGNSNEGSSNSGSSSWLPTQPL